MTFHVSPASLASIVPQAPAPARLGPHDLLNPDGSYNLSNLMRMAHRRAASELEGCRALQACGRIAATSKLTYARELQGALKHYWTLARQVRFRHRVRPPGRWCPPFRILISTKGALP